MDRDLDWDLGLELAGVGEYGGGSDGVREWDRNRGKCCDGSNPGGGVSFCAGFDNVSLKGGGDGGMSGFSSGTELTDFGLKEQRFRSDSG